MSKTPQKRFLIGMESLSKIKNERFPKKTISAKTKFSSLECKAIK